MENKQAVGIRSNGKVHQADVVISGADYHHSESLLQPQYRAYSEAYWDKKTFAPSSLLFFVGIDKKVKNVSHHTLFFDVDFDAHAADIYDHPKWPERTFILCQLPFHHRCFDGTCRQGSLLLLIPIAPGLEDTPELREKYFNIVRSFGRIDRPKNS